MARIVFMVAVGSGIGGALRFLISLWMHGDKSHGFPWSTFWVNMLGSLLIGFLYTIFSEYKSYDPAAAFFMTGLCGGFTTFSAFTLENSRLLQHSQYTTALMYSLSSLILGVFLVFTGILLAKTLVQMNG